MKQLFLTSMLWVVCIQSYAQSVDYKTNAPRCGDIIKRHQINYFYDGEEGRNVTWDFSNINTTYGDVTTEYFYDKDSVLCSVDSKMISKYQLSDDTLKLIGYKDRLNIMDYTEPVTLVTYPFAYGYSITNNYDGTGMYCQRLVTKHKGTVIVEANAEGCAINADGDTLRHVIRIHTIRTSSLCMYDPADTLFADSTHMKQEIQDINQWYVHGYRYPLYETKSTAYYDNMTPVSCVRTAYMYSPDDEKYLEDTENKQIREDIARENTAGKNIIHYTITNNGTSVVLDYDLDAEASINALLCNSRGMVYGRKKAHMAGGTGYQISFDTVSLPRGEYILYINVNGKVYNEKFCKY